MLPPDPVHALRRASRTQAGRFLAVGAVATVVDVGLFNVLHALAGLDPVLSKALSTAVAAAVAYVGNRQWSFDDGCASRPRAQALPYLLVTLAGLGVSLVPVAAARALGHEGLVAMNLAANVLGLGLGTCLRFYGYRRWVFAAPTPAPTAAVPIRSAADEGLRRAA